MYIYIYVHTYIYIYIYIYIYTHILYTEGEDHGTGYIRPPLEDSRLFGPSPWRYVDQQNSIIRSFLVE